MEMTQAEWLELGLKQGWCGPALCFTHDGVPTSLEEDELFEQYDPCIHIVRLYETPEIKMAVENNHSASIWRQ